MCHETHGKKDITVYFAQSPRHFHRPFSSNHQTKTSIMRDLSWVQTLKRIRLEQNISFRKAIALFPCNYEHKTHFLTSPGDEHNVYVTKCHKMFEMASTKMIYWCTPFNNQCIDMISKPNNARKCMKVYYTHRIAPTCFGHSCSHLQEDALQRIGTLKYYRSFWTNAQT